MWTHFWNMHSGGSLKEKFAHIYIEAPKEEAIVIFYNRFGHNPERVTCTCCGSDYSISEEELIEQLTAYERGCDYVYFRPNGDECLQDEAWVIGEGLKKGYTSGYVERENKGKFSWQTFQSLKEFSKRKDIAIIKAREIKPFEKKGTVPVEGYVWKGGTK